MNENKRLCLEECAWLNCTIIDNNNKNISVFGQCISTKKTKVQEWNDVCRANYGTLKK
jgi:hypothetical protein